MRRPRQRRYRSPDGIDWRDPNMPVLRDYRMVDGTIKTTVDADYERRYREMLMQYGPQPSYRSDNTYNPRRRK